MWSVLKNTNTDKYLLTIKKLQLHYQPTNQPTIHPSIQLFIQLRTQYAREICILKYLNAIEPIAFVNASKLPNNSCGRMVFRAHIDVLHMAATEAFRCFQVIQKQHKYHLCKWNTGKMQIPIQWSNVYRYLSFALANCECAECACCFVFCWCSCWQFWFGCDISQ